MLKMMIIGRRRSAMTLKQVHSYMATVHGPMVVDCFHQYPDVAPYRYVQNHVFDSAHRTANQGSDALALNRDFVTQVWFKDPAAAALALQQPFYKEKLQPDEDNFVDQATVLKIPVTERKIFGSDEPLGRFKVFCLFQKLDIIEGVDFQRRWDEFSATLTQKFPGLQRHVQCDPMGKPGAPQLLHGINECWFGSQEEAVFAAERALAFAKENELIETAIAPNSIVVLIATEMLLFKSD